MRAPSVPSMIRVRSDSRIFTSTAANASYINTISLPVGNWRFASRTFYRLTRRALIRSVSAAKEPDRRGIVLEPLAYLQWRDQYFFHYPLEDLGLLAEAMRRFLESGDRPSIGGLNDLREAAERIKAYRQRRSDHFDRRTVNSQLLALSEQEGRRQ